MIALEEFSLLSSFRRASTDGTYFIHLLDPLLCSVTLFCLYAVFAKMLSWVTFVLRFFNFFFVNAFSLENRT